MRYGDAAEPDVAIADDDVVAITYTSGTESRPKGAMLTSRSLIAQYVSCIVDGEMTRDDVEVHALPLYHCAQLDVFLMPGPLPRGHERHPARADAGRDPARRSKPSGRRSCSARRRSGSACCAPRTSTRRDLSSLRKGYYGASIMPVEVLREMQRRGCRDVRLWNLYGQTEIAPLATRAAARGPAAQGRARPAGRRINVETRVVDDR